MDISFKNFVLRIFKLFFVLLKCLKIILYLIITTMTMINESYKKKFNNQLNDKK